jgi:protein-tyrosine sulfotransferase
MESSFILSSARSGSTLARFLIDTHPDIYCPGELRMGELAAVLYWCIASLEGRFGRPRAENAAILAQAREVIAGLLESKTREKGKRMWCEKTPDNLTYLSLLTTMFPDSRFICLYRHAKDVARSCLERSRFGFLPVLEKYVHRSPRNTIVAAVEYWVDCTSALLDLEKERPGQTFRLRYEDVVLSPETALPPLFRFLGVEWDAAILERVFTAPHDEGEGDGFVRFAGRIHRESLGVGRNLAVETVMPDLFERMASLLAELGYDAEPVRPAAVIAAGTTREGANGNQRETPRWVFETLVAERLSAAGGTLPPLACTVEVLGQGGGTWSLEIGEKGARVSPGGETPCRIEIQAADLLDIVHGRANALKTVEDGKIRIRGMLSQRSIRDFVLLIRTDLEQLPSSAS